MTQCVTKKRVAVLGVNAEIAVGAPQYLNTAWVTFKDLDGKVGAAACEGNYGGGNPDAAGVFVMDLAVAADRLIYAELSKARASGALVTVGGAGTYIGPWERMSQCWLDNVG